MSSLSKSTAAPAQGGSQHRGRRPATAEERLKKRARAAWYRLLQAIIKPLCVFLFRLRVEGRTNMPQTGGVLLVANHQSYLDPIVVGVAMRRRPNYLARGGLFKWAPFRWLIQSLEAIPIRREALGLDGIKEALRRLHGGECVLIFPEGSRTPDGTLQKLYPGFATLAARAKVPILPVGIAGAFAAWPNQRKFPRLRKVSVFFAPPLSAEEIRPMPEPQAIALIRERLLGAIAEAERYCGST